MSYSLGINTASSHTTLILLRDSEIIAAEYWKSANDEAEKLMPTIQNMLSEISYEEIKRIYVVKGPGSFTGLRVGVTVANTLAYLTGAELHAFSTFEYWQAQSDLPIVVFAGKKAVYFNGEVVSLSEISEIPAAKVFGDLSEEQISAFGDRYVAHDGRWCEQLLSAITKIKTTPVKIVQPLYVKAPGITPAKLVSIISPQF